MAVVVSSAQLKPSRYLKFFVNMKFYDENSI
jgi:hypothetical protein